MIPILRKRNSDPITKGQLFQLQLEHPLGFELRNTLPNRRARRMMGRLKHYSAPQQMVEAKKGSLLTRGKRFVNNLLTRDKR